MESFSSCHTLTSVRIDEPNGGDAPRLIIVVFSRDMQLAIALYNNNVDDEDELEFHKGDVLNVLIENPNGLNGWWLCEYKGRCGLCPANRLQLVSGTSTNKSNESLRSAHGLSSLSVRFDIRLDAPAIHRSHFTRHTMVPTMTTIFQ